MRTLFALLVACALATSAQAQPTTAVATSTIENPDGGQCGSCCAHRAEGADASAGCCAGMNEGQTEASGHGGGMACCAGMHREGETHGDASSCCTSGASCCGSGASCCGEGRDAEGGSSCCGRMEHGDASHEGHGGGTPSHHEMRAEARASGGHGGCCCGGHGAQSGGGTAHD
ncbi:MAG TPA: hypothetical protein VD962_04915 [Rubricoccaceae bacterium]|nr:hypothetical protein [Rubricoccaceae bacterium]